MNVEMACTVWERLVGLHAHRDLDGALLLAPCNDIHTFGMKRAIDVAFVSAGGEVLESHRGVGPWRRLRNAGATATLERFASDDDWYEPGDRVQHTLHPVGGGASARKER